MPEELELLFKEITIDFPRIMGNSLVGIYVWGSLSYGAFDESCSDADLIIVTKDIVTDNQFNNLKTWFKSKVSTNSWATKTEIRFVIDNEFFDTSSQCCGFYFGEFSRHGSDGNPIIWVNIRDCGITLWGKEAKSIAPEVSDPRLNESLLLELWYLKDDNKKNAGVHTEHTFKHINYSVLTACRIYYTALFRKLVPKDIAFQWAIKNLPSEWHPLINTARENRLKDKGKKAAGMEISTMQFIEYVENEVRKVLS